MADLDWHLTHTGETTFVELVVRTDRRKLVAIESELDPEWPPRYRGRPETGWEGSTYEGTIPAGDRCILGYASPAEPVHPPARIISETTVSKERADEVPSPDELVQALGRAEPARDAIQPGLEPDIQTPTETPASANREPTESAHAQTESDNGQSTDQPFRSTGEQWTLTHEATAGGRRPASRAAQPEPTGEGTSVDSYLDGVHRRLGDAERLSAADTVVEARAAVDAVGGMAAVRELESRLQRDSNRLDEMEDTRADLAAHLARIDIPVEALEQLV